jgi:pilus assembly protein Flp/PilA
MGRPAKAETMGNPNLKSSVERFLGDEAGATAIEYALIAVGISVAILAGVQALGGSVSAMYDTIAEKVSAQMAR